MWVASDQWRRKQIIRITSKGNAERRLNTLSTIIISYAKEVSALAFIY